jgi:MFS family permease
MARADRDHSPPTRSFAALRNPGYRAFFVTTMLAMMADSIEHVISYWVVFQKFHSHALGGFAVISHWLPYLLLSVWAGSLADRRDPRRLIQIGMGLFAFVSLAWGVLFLYDALQVWHAAVLLTLHGVAGVLWGPVGQVLLHDVVDKSELPSAVRLNATSRYLGLLAGPALGSALMLALGPTRGILVNAVFYVPSIWWLWRAPYGPRFRRGPAVARVAMRSLRDLGQTLRDVARDRPLASMIGLSGAAALFVGNAYQAQMPAFAHELGHGDAGVAYSALIGADAAGALLAGLVLEARQLLPPSPRSALALGAAWCAAIGSFALSRSYGWALVLLFLTGFFELSFNSMAQTIVQLRAPDAIRGRIIGLYATSSLGLRCFAGFSVGLVGASIGVHRSLALSALFVALVIAALGALGRGDGFGRPK